MHLANYAPHNVSDMFCLFSSPSSSLSPSTVTPPAPQLTSMYSSYLDYCQDSREYVYISRMGMHMQSNWQIIFFYFYIFDFTMHLKENCQDDSIAVRS